MNKATAIVEARANGSYLVTRRIPRDDGSIYEVYRAFNSYGEARTYALDHVQQDPERVITEGMV